MDAAQVTPEVGVGAEPAKEATENKDAKQPESSPDEKLPWHKDVRWQAFQAEKKNLQAAQDKLNAILKANNLEDADDLEELVQSGKAIKGKITDPSVLDAIIAKATKLDQYEAYWAEQKEKERRRNEDPEERAERLEKQLAVEKRRRQFEENQKKQADEARRALDNYESVVKSQVKEWELPKEHFPFALEFMGIGNPCNEIDITDPKQVKRITNEFKKKLEDFKQSVIKDYLKGKQDVPKVTATTPTTSTADAPKIKLKEARNMAQERIRALFSGG